MYLFALSILTYRMNALSYEQFFDLSSFEHALLFEGNRPMWEVLKELKNFLDLYPFRSINCDIPRSAVLKDPHLISIGEGTLIEPGAYIQGPCIIGKNCLVRHGSYIRPYLLTGDRCVIGHSTETKYAILLNGVKASHFNYVGDSIIGNDVNLGAGVICANMRLDEKPISVCFKDKRIPTGLKKFGSIIGDGSKIGCHAVLNPGVLLKKKTKICSSKGVFESNMKVETINV